MKVEVDLNKCQGYANCVMEAPDVFDLDGNGKSLVLTASIAESQMANARRAAENCPVAAIRLEE